MNQDEEIKEIESKIQTVKDSLTKVDELLADVKNCSGNTTKALIL